MFDPYDRCLLIESLRPPEGYRLDFAVGTTFSLDLSTLLLVPFAFTGFDWESEEDGAGPNPLARLEAVRRYADRIAIFCQAGRIQIPREDHTLFGFLESSVFEAAPPGEKGAFHAKSWVLRYSNDTETPRYRVLCLSRNLTPDRSWDTVAALEGELKKRGGPYKSSRPLAELVRHLPAFSRRRLPPEWRSRIRRMSGELLRVRFEPPPDFDRLRFWAPGVPGQKSWPFLGEADRSLVVSPFLSENCLERLEEEGGETILVSRPESLEEIRKERLRRFRRIYCLNADLNAVAENEGQERPGEGIPLHGLHAKLFIREKGWEARLFTGSANATNAAFNGNVEFLAELIGSKSRCGIDRLLRKEKNRTRFIDLLEEFSPESQLPPEQETDLERRVEEMRVSLASASLLAQVIPIGKGDRYCLELRNGGKAPLRFPRGMDIACRPISLPESAEIRIARSGKTLSRFGPLGLLDLTSFFAFTVTAGKGRKKITVRFAITVPLRGAPMGRKEAIVRSVVSDRSRFQQYLMFLLSGDQPEVRWLIQNTSANASHGSIAGMRGGDEETALLEKLIQALHSDPEKIEWVAELVNDMKKSGDSAAILPPGFDAIWKPIRKAGERIRHGK